MTEPRAPALDSTAPLLEAPYDYVGRTCDGLSSDAFAARLLLRRTICMRGPRAAALFYDEDRFVRSGAMPEPVRATLLGKGGLQGLDGPAHRRRKALFMSFMTPENVDELVRQTERQWIDAIPAWTASGRVSLYGVIQPILMRAVCNWAGVPLLENEAEVRTRDTVALFDKAAALGIGHLQARFARRRLERWLTALVTEVRRRPLFTPATALETIAFYRDGSAQLLPPHIAAVELLNLIRPTVAVSVYIVLLAHAVEMNPDAVPAADDAEGGERFVQEVRRFYPFFPALMARVQQDFDWKGVTFPRGRRVLLDLHGTNMAREWGDPEEFRPDRFATQARDPFLLVPQGGGDHHQHHRCPGEAITVALMKLALRMLTECLAYDVPRQNLEIDRTRMPALPVDRFVLNGVQLR